jgi:hypothetical protein
MEYSIRMAKVYCNLSLHNDQSRNRRCAPQQGEISLITTSLDSKVATAPFPPIYHEHNHDSKHNLIDCIGILPRDDIYLP